MNLTMFSVFTTMFLFAFIALLINRRHIILTLLTIELMTVIIIASIFAMNTQFIITPLPILTLLTFSACEASLGLALLVIMIRASGNDHVNMLPLYKS